jgi:hypothetical protein
MLLFESASAGVVAIFVGFMAVMTIVGVYVIVVWPLTFWDLGNLHLERFNSWAEPALWSVFGGGTLAGFLCFSGLAFGTSKPKATPASRVSAGKMPQPGVSGRARELRRQ